ncbi:AAA+ superfamily domain protein [Wolbachia endosymbiont of Wuchereria bancrofti]|nr:AAA+ superfamily domain protein [Wolbachia endosymbiont of Wuchereria bancrofti]
MRATIPVLERFFKFYSILSIIGSRQSGKITIAKTLFKHLPYISLENIDTSFQAQIDPRAFLANYNRVLF